jgi:hypothetical protein
MSEKFTRIEDLDKEDLIDRCREIEYWNLRIIDHNRTLRFRLGQFEELFECDKCLKTVKLELYREGGGYGSSAVTCARCIVCKTEIKDSPIGFL